MYMKCQEKLSIFLGRESRTGHIAFGRGTKTTTTLISGFEISAVRTCAMGGTPGGLITGKISTPL